MIKVVELTGAKLDYWVAKAEGREVCACDGPVRSGFHPEICFSCKKTPGDQLSYSTDWSQGGPIIERERIQPRFCKSGTFIGEPFTNKWFATHPSRHMSEMGDTLLIAAMRCYVASKFGDEVPDK